MDPSTELPRILPLTEEAERSDDAGLFAETQIVAAAVGIGLGQCVLQLFERDPVTPQPVRIRLDFVALDGCRRRR